LSQIIEQKKNQLTAEDIFPLWCEQLRKGEGVVLAKGLGAGYSHCIVGEAYGYNDGSHGTHLKFECPECHRLCHRLVNGGPNNSAAVIVGKNLDGDKVIKKINWHEYEQYKDEFTEHWNEVHTN
jgi:hypothetical protein